MIRRSRVYSSEAKTKTRKSKRTIRLHPGTIHVLRSVWPIHTKPEDYVFTTPGGSPINEQNFLQRVWSPALRRLGLRDRGFYACRATYCSTMISLGKKVAFVAEQTGHSIRTLEARYKKYFPSADDLEIPDQQIAEGRESGISSTFSLHPKAKVEKKGGT
jgi:integrase